MRNSWLAMIVVACFTSGCAVISTGAPTAEPDKGTGALLSKPYHRMLAMPPQPNWSATDVVEGLQSTMASFDDAKWSVLRQYLVPEKAATWKPSGTISVIENDVKIEQESDTQIDAKNPVIQLKGTKIAELDDEGRYVPVTRTAFLRNFNLVKVADSYRVSGLEDGLVLTQADLNRAYRQANLYFLDSPVRGLGAGARRTVVPDPVWLRVDPKVDLAKTIVERLILGPSSSLKGAVHYAIPEDAKVESVRVVEDTVVVDFAPGFQVPREALDAMQVQLGWTLNDVAKGRTIEVRVGGEPYFGSEPLTITQSDIQTALPKYDAPSAFYASAGAVYSPVTKGRPERVAGAAGEQNDVYTHQTISPDGQLIAANSSAGGIWVTRMTIDAKWEKWIDGTDLTAPTWHRDGTLWTVNKITSAVMTYRPLNQQQHLLPIAAPNIGEGVQMMKIARDGVRVAVVNRDKNGWHVSIGAITSEAGQMIQNLQTLMTVSDEDDQQILDLAWSDSTHLYVLGKLKSGVGITKIDLEEGAATSVPKADARTTSIAAYGSRLLAGTTEKGQPGPVLERKEGKDWEELPDGAQGIPLFKSG